MLHCGELITQRAQGYQAVRGRHYFFDYRVMESKQKELTIGQGVITKLAARPTKSVSKAARKNDQASVFKDKGLAPHGSAAEQPLPLFMEMKYKAREFDPL